LGNSDTERRRSGSSNITGELKFGLRTTLKSKTIRFWTVELCWNLYRDSRCLFRCLPEYSAACSDPCWRLSSVALGTQRIRRRSGSGNMLVVTEVWFGSTQVQDDKVCRALLLLTEDDRCLFDPLPRYSHCMSPTLLCILSSARLGNSRYTESEVVVVISLVVTEVWTADDSSQRR
jgi:hypothetical protein